MNIFLNAIAGCFAIVVGAAEYYLYKNMSHYWWDTEFTIIFMMLPIVIAVYGLYKIKLEMDQDETHIA